MNTVTKAKQNNDINVARITKTIERRKHLIIIDPRYKNSHEMIIAAAIVELEALGYKAITVTSFDFRTGAYATTTEIVKVA